MAAAIALLSGLLLASSPEAPAEPVPDEIPEWVEPVLEPLCEPGSERAHEAGGLLRELSKVVSGLNPGDSIQPFLAAFEALGKHHCFKGVSDFPFEFPDASVAAEQAREWWFAGGEHWLRSLIEYGGHVRRVVVPPDLRHRLGPKSGGPMKALACDPKSSGCASGEAWRTRATSALASACEPWALKTTRECLRSYPESYQGWRACVDWSEGRSIEVPLGHFNPPTTGWLVIRRTTPLDEHGEVNCATTKVYSLDRGEAWFVDGCRNSAVHVGRVPVLPLRQLALLFIVKEQVQEDVRVRAHDVDIPPAFNQGLGDYGLIQCRGIAIIGDWRTLSWQVLSKDYSEEGLDEGLAVCRPGSKVIGTWQQELDQQLVPACPAALPSASDVAQILRGLPAEDKAERQHLEHLKAALRRPSKQCEAAAK